MTLPLIRMEDLLAALPINRQLTVVLFSFFGGWLLRLISQSLIARISRRAGFLDGDIVARNAGTAIIWCSMLLGVDIFVPDTVYPDAVRPAVGMAYHALCILIVAVMVARTARRILHRMAERRGTGIGTTSLLDKTVQIAIYIIALALVLDAFGVELTAMLATLGVGGLALALALQETLTNLFAGMYITIANQIRTGDVIVFDGNEGAVLDIGWRNTLIRKLDDSLLIVPNAKLSQAVVSSYAADAPNFRTRVSVPVSVEEDIGRVERLMSSIVDAAGAGPDAIQGLLLQPAPLVRIGEWRDGFIEVVVICSVDTYL
ncbi:MAG: mechanosensitive ion channel family protein, partial [Candidatus Kapaibacterium sp.]